MSLARAFASQPEVMLLDEPFAGVDAPTREGLIEDFAEILSETRPDPPSWSRTTETKRCDSEIKPPC